MKIRKFVVVNAISALMFVFGPQQTAAQSAWQKGTGTAANVLNVYQEFRGAFGSKKPKARLVSGMPSASRVSTPAQSRGCDPKLVKITSRNKNAAWTNVLVGLGQGFKKRGWCYVVPAAADDEAYSFDLVGYRGTGSSGGGWLNGFGHGGSSTNRGGTDSTMQYVISLIIYAPDGSIADSSAEAEVVVRASGSHQFFGSTGGLSYNRYASDYSSDPDTAAIRAALYKFFG